jgi:hypothetical protein
LVYQVRYPLFVDSFICSADVQVKHELKTRELLKINCPQYPTCARWMKETSTIWVTVRYRTIVQTVHRSGIQRHLSAEKQIHHRSVRL